MNIQERKNKNGDITSYRIRVFDHKDPYSGMQVVRTLSVKYIHEKSPEWNRRNAQAHGLLFEKQIKDQTASFSNQLFYDYCCYAIKTKVDSGLSSATAYNYRNCLEKLLPYMGHLRLKNITPAVINKTYSSLLEKGVSKTTVYQLHLFIHSMLAMALKEDLIPRNYADAATPPREKKKSIKVLSESDIGLFFHLLYSSENDFVYKVFFTLLLASGCRIGELCALTWADVDLCENRIHVCKHFVTDADGRHIQKGSKTDSGDRWIFMDDEIMNMLKEYRAYYLKTASEYGDSWNTAYDALFFSARKRGKYLTPEGIRAWLRKFTSKHDLSDIHPHVFRHTAISMQLAAGIGVADIAKRAGHSRPDVTLRIYSHVVRDNDILCCEAVTNVLPRMPSGI